MPPRFTLLAPLLLPVVGCGEEVEPCGDPCGLGDAHNFSYQSQLSAEVLPAKALADIELEWSGLHTDIQGHPVADPSEIDQVLLVVFPELTPEDALEGLASDTLAQRDIGAYMICAPEGASSCTLDSFGLLGSYPGMSDYFTEDSGSWLFALSTEGVDGARSLVFVDPIASSEVTTISIDDDTASLDVQVDLHSSTAAGLEPGTSPTMDWSGVSVDGLGLELFHEKLDLLEVAHFAMEPSEVEAQFFDLRTLADEWWSLETDGRTSAGLDELQGERAFPGVDDQGTWLMVLWCSTCSNPVPKVIVRLEPT